MIILGYFRRRQKTRPTNLQIELVNLKKNIRITENHMSDLSREFWSNGGLCCEGCGIPGWHGLVIKQQRREERIEQIEAKLTKHAQRKK